jgi:hypothetical protein
MRKRTEHSRVENREPVASKHYGKSTDLCAPDIASIIESPSRKKLQVNSLCPDSTRPILLSIWLFLRKKRTLKTSSRSK